MSPIKEENKSKGRIDLRQVDKILKDLMDRFRYAKERIEGNFSPSGIPEYSEEVIYFLASNKNEAQRIFKQLEEVTLNGIGILIEKDRDKQIYAGFNLGERGILFRIDWEDYKSKNHFTKEIEALKNYNPRE